MSNGFKIRKLRNKKVYVLDWETVGVGPRLASISKKPLPSIFSQNLPKSSKPFLKPELPTPYQFGSQYDMLAIRYEALRLLSNSTGKPIVTAIQRNFKKTVNVFTTFDLRNIRL